MTVDKGKGERITVRNVVYHGGMCPRCEGMGSVSDFDLTRCTTRTSRSPRALISVPGYKAGGWSVRYLHRVRIPRS